LAEFTERLNRGELAYQYDLCRRRAVFYPRVAEFFEGAFEWRVSAGWGVVYATTTVFAQEGPPRNVALVDLDEGFRMMSRVSAPAGADVRIGMRVRARVHFEADRPPCVVFEAAA
jgi:uncharacterized OB-fold protein